MNPVQHPDFINTSASPSYTHAKLFGGEIDEIAYAILNAGGDDEVLGPVLLKH